MKNYACAKLCSIAIFLFSCNAEESTVDKGNVVLNDNISAQNRAVDAFKKEVLASRDSIDKYKIEAVNDTCLNYIYTIYGAKKLKHYDLIIDDCSIKLTDFKKIEDSLYRLRYTVFIKDTIPIIADLSEDAIIHTFEYDRVRNKIIKAYLGQHSSYLEEKELMKMYYFSQAQIKANYKKDP